MEKLHFFNLRRRAPALVRWSLRAALVVAAVSALALLALLVWSTGNASRYAQQYDTLLVLNRSDEHTSELQSLVRISYAVFCLKKKKNYKLNHNTYTTTTH